MWPVLALLAVRSTAAPPAGGYRPKDPRFSLNLLLHPDAGIPWLTWLGAGALLAVTAYDAIVQHFVLGRRDQGGEHGRLLWTSAALRDRRGRDRVGEIRASGDALIIRNPAGLERWLPRTGENAVATLRPTHIRTPIRDLRYLELRTARGKTRAVLPAEHWLGESGVDDLAKALAPVGIGYEPDSTRRERTAGQRTVESAKPYEPFGLHHDLRSVDRRTADRRRRNGPARARLSGHARTGPRRCWRRRSCPP